MTKPNGWEDLNDLFEWTDFSGDVGSYVLVVKTDSYDTEETARKKVADLFRQAILSAEENLLREIMEEMPKESEYAEEGQYELGWSTGFDEAIDQVNTLLERKLSTVKKI